MKINYWAAMEPNNCYHIYNRAVGRDNLFTKNSHYAYFLSRCQRYLQPYFSIYAYCLMPNHFHVLVKARPVDEHFLANLRENPSKKASQLLQNELTIAHFYADQFKSMFNSYSATFNKDQNRHGSLFQAKFKRITIRDRAHFLRIFYYIHHNPIHHRFCYKYADWEYSSYNDYFSSDKNYLLAKEPIFQLFGNDPELLAKGHELYKINFASEFRAEDSFEE